MGGCKSKVQSLKDAGPGCSEAAQAVATSAALYG